MDKKKHVKQTEAETEVNETAGTAENTENAEETQTETPVDETAELMAKVEEAEKKCAEYLENMKRSQADFINYKRRNETAMRDSYDEGVRDTLTALLPVIDNLERALKAANDAGEEGAMVEGVRMTLNQLTASFEKLGLEEIKAEGEKFDPELHNAVMRVEEGEPGTVQTVFQKGYRAKGKMIRYAMVSVMAE